MRHCSCHGQAGSSAVGHRQVARRARRGTAVTGAPALQLVGPGQHLGHRRVQRRGDLRRPASQCRYSARVSGGASSTGTLCSRCQLADAQRHQLGALGDHARRAPSHLSGVLQGDREVRRVGDDDVRLRHLGHHPPALGHLPAAAAGSAALTCGSPSLSLCSWRRSSLATCAACGAHGSTAATGTSMPRPPAAASRRSDAQLAAHQVRTACWQRRTRRLRSCSDMHAPAEVVHDHPPGDAADQQRA
jgi:hypothetical protein